MDGSVTWNLQTCLSDAGGMERQGMFVFSCTGHF